MLLLVLWLIKKLYVFTCVVMTLSSTSKRHKSVRTRGGSPQNDDGTLALEMGRVELLLNQTCFFSERDQMILYAT